MTEDAKKAEVLTFRTSSELKNDIASLAKEKKWTLSQTIENIIYTYMIQPELTSIIIKTSELQRVHNELLEDHCGAVELSIDMIHDCEGQGPPDEKIYKGINISGLQSGGLGYVMGYDPIEELSKEQLLDIP